MRPSDQPEPSPRLGRTPPAPPGAPPTTGEADGPDVPNGPPRARIGGLGKVVALGLMALLVAVWFAGIASVAPAFLAVAGVALFRRGALFLARRHVLPFCVSCSSGH